DDLLDCGRCGARRRPAEGRPRDLQPLPRPGRRGPRMRSLRASHKTFLVQDLGGMPTSSWACPGPYSRPTTTWTCHPQTDRSGRDPGTVRHSKISGEWTLFLWVSTPFATAGSRRPGDCLLDAPRRIEP